MMRRLRRFVVVAGVALLLVGTGCFHAFWQVQAARVDRPAQGAADVFVSTPVKAHLADGAIVVFRNGATISRTAVFGSGERFTVRLASAGATANVVIPFDSIVGLETFEGKMLAAQSVVVSAAATAAAAVGTAALMVAIFGSCPTLYADTGSAAPLEAEGFSYAIAPLLEQRDLDPLRVKPGPDGVIRLELRNEALETHYINQLELVAVTHRDGARAVPDQSGRPVVVDDLRAVSGAVDRSGRDVRPQLSAADGQYYETPAAVVRAAREGNLEDWIELSADDLPPGDSVAVVLRLRNSLLNTVLLYEGVLGGHDAPEWMQTGLQHISTAIDLSKWYMRTMGMRAYVDGVARSAWGEAWDARLGDVGPLAFRDVAMVLPRPARDARRVRVRLRFVADNWRIDRAEIAGKISRPRTTTLPVASIVAPVSATVSEEDTAAVAAVREADGRYLETLPGQRMTLRFRAPRDAGDGMRTTYLVSWQGWYNEWIRGQWLANPTRTEAWVPGDRAVLTALDRWQQRKSDFEAAFYSTRIPVR